MQNLSCNHSSYSLFSCLSRDSVEPDGRADSREAACLCCALCFPC